MPNSNPNRRPLLAGADDRRGRGSAVHRGWLCIIASEDVGLADPQAIVQAASAAQITHLIGLPEALFPLAQATIYLAQAPKSNLVATAYTEAAADAAATAREPVPLHLRNAVTALVKSIGYGKGYRYVHDDPAAHARCRAFPSRSVAITSPENDDQRAAGRSWREGPSARQAAARAPETAATNRLERTTIPGMKIAVSPAAVWLPR